MGASGALADAPTDLERAQAERGQLHALHAGQDQPPAQGVQQPVGRPVQQQPHLIGQEAMPGEPIAKTGRFQVFDPVLRLAAGGVPGGERLRGSSRVVTTKRVLGPLARVFGFDGVRARPTRLELPTRRGVRLPAPPATDGSPQPAPG
jgi:hypothetical protein